MTQTIFAQSSKLGKAGVSLFRISGPWSLNVILSLFNDTTKTNITPRYMYHRKIYNPETLELIDNAMIVYFKAPSSFTGEDVVEIYTHGSIAITKILYDTLSKMHDLRIAEPGEFTQRAFLNNKLDLTGVEGVADLIDAETAMQHKQAMSQLSGNMQKLYDSWRRSLLSVISLFEAYIDFPDEDISTSVLDQAMSIIKELRSTINKYLNDNRRGELLRSGIKLSIIGHPNVGKSSLLNLLTQREVAIVSSIAGTTRDVIETHLDIGGYPIILQDTAGIRSGSMDLVEQEGINRAIIAAKDSDIKIVMMDVENLNLPKEIETLIDNNTIIVVNKIDIMANISKHIEEQMQVTKISIAADIGLDILIDRIKNIAANITSTSEHPVITRQRHRNNLEEALNHLTNCDPYTDVVLSAENIRNAIKSLASLTGEITVEEILGEIFSNFCIGK